MSLDTLQLTTKFRSLFNGRTDAYGLRHGEVVRSVLTDRQYGRHLSGTDSFALGVFPLRDDGTVNFCAIDLDRHEPDTAWHLAQLVPGLSWVECTRSANYHVWSFFDRPLAAWVARFIMRSVLEAAGQENVEVFPKTDTLRPGMLGNYINLPYPGNHGPGLQCIVDPMGKAIDLFEFVNEADYHRVEADTWVTRARTLGGQPPEEREQAAEFGTQATLHECAPYILERARSGEQPLEEGHRSKVLFALAKQLLNWERGSARIALGALQQVNQSCTRPLPEREVERILGTVMAGQYTSTSCDDPVVRPYCRPDCPIARGS